MAAREELTDRLARRWRRLNGPSRHAGIDLARGLAVVGMLAAHLLTTTDLVWSDPATWSGVVDGRSSILFATLAGISIGLVTGGRTPVRGPALARAATTLALRALIIWVLGVLLMATGVPVYVILPAYAILFLLVLPLLTLGPAVLFGIAALIGVIGPVVYALIMMLPIWDVPGVEDVSLLLGWHYPFVVWAAFVVAGLALGRLELRSASVQAAMLLIGGGLALLSYGLAPAEGGRMPGLPASASLLETVWSADPHSSGMLEVFGSGGFAIAVTGACLLLCRPWWSRAARPGAWLGPVGWAALPVRAVGSMPLTAYTAQIVGWAIAAALLLGDTSDLTGFRALDPFGAFVFWTALGCTAWALLFGRGPLEWVTARLSGRASRRSAPEARG
ncbi:heparan-alpha-glucosaminide N-acetyltransferase domain-containing protein [Microbacterium sp. LRZ72]|uniref:heparan-alpha-glucosaminide N-acetyltransferase domain-containing protein n=1 Tax=Microbacterium sp. LRZ72 TaxID=2942481 RepID=UPI0029B3C697|nr:heparan-alpha-glucosaminide N-acetyltransferase domain-containing protein [Microbacterium sp. LRZ72]MDX2375695.1 heparan-alpha-glucosaminide N-acetyltransferase domain-containing protein [Microbacterium sp. LRZ72]